MPSQNVLIAALAEKARNAPMVGRAMHLRKSILIFAGYAGVLNKVMYHNLRLFFCVLYMTRQTFVLTYGHSRTR